MFLISEVPLQVKNVVRAPDGSVLAIVSNHSRWLDAVDDERFPIHDAGRCGGSEGFWVYRGTSLIRKRTLLGPCRRGVGVFL